VEPGAGDEEEGSGKPPADVRVVLHPDNGVSCAVRLSTAAPLQYSPSLASAWSGVTLTPAPSGKLDGASPGMHGRVLTGRRPVVLLVLVFSAMQVSAWLPPGLPRVGCRWCSTPPTLLRVRR